MIVKKLESGHGRHGCYKCKKRKASWSAKITFSNIMSSSDITVYLCNDCAKLTEDQLRIYFLG